MPNDEMEYWQEKRFDRLTQTGRQPFPIAYKVSPDQTSFMYVPDEFIVDRALVPDLDVALASADIVPPPDREPDGHWLEGTGLLVYGYTGDPEELPALVARLRQQAGSDRVSLHYVLSGEKLPTVPRGGPATAPAIASALAPMSDWGDGVDAPVVAVLDTGVFRGSQAERAQAAGGGHAVGFRGPGQAPNDIDTLHAELPDGSTESTLAGEAGHGSFIAALIQRMAGGGIGIEAWKVLDADGLGSEKHIVEALRAIRERPGAKPKVINLSLGGFTDNAGWFDPAGDPELRAAYGERIDLMPLGLGAELARWSGDPLNQTVFVCAAGNDGQRRPFWPAAAAQDVEDGDLADIVAVAALDRTMTPTEFSNSGPWVSVGTIGTDIVSDYPRGVFPVADGTILTFQDGAASWSGTSFAAPVVTAQIAWLSAGTGRPPTSGRHGWAWLRSHLGPRDPMHGRVFDPRVFPPHHDPGQP